MKKIILFCMFLSVVALFGQTITPIANIQDSINVYNGENVTIEGIITVGAGITNNNWLAAFIQDESGRGIMIYDGNITAAYEQDMVRGNKLQISGEIEEYGGATEIKDFSYSVISTGNPEPSALILDIADDLEIYEGTLVQVTGTIYDVYPSGGNTNLNIEDASENQTTVRIWGSTGIDVSEYVEGYLLEARGAGGIFDNNFQVLPGYEDHLGEGNLSQYPYGDIDINVGTPIKIDFSHTTDFETILLFWKTNSDYEFDHIEMISAPNKSSYFEAYFPAQDQGASIDFYLTAYDSLNNEFIFPEDYPNTNPYNFKVPISDHAAVLNVPAKAFNPYSGETFPIEFGSENGDKVILRIYNSEGKIVNTLQNTIISSGTGIIHYNWNGRDKNNNLLPLGLYICYLEVTDINSGRKKTAKAPIVIGAPLK